MRWSMLVLVVGCGGGGSDATELTATIHDGNAVVDFAGTCALEDRGDGVFGLAAVDGDYGFEALWLASDVTAAGTYDESQIGDGGSFSLLANGSLLLAHGSLTFDTYDAPASVSGSLSWIAQQGAAVISATADFTCQ